VEAAGLQLAGCLILAITPDGGQPFIQAVRPAAGAPPAQPTRHVRRSILVEVENLTKYYGDTPAIDGVTFEMKKGEILGFLGPNAAGKTTTMRIMTGFMPPTSGTVRIAGIDVQEEPVEAKRLMGYLPENVPLYEDLSVSQYLTFFARLRGVSKRRLLERVRFAMEATNVAERENWVIGKLSKGFRRRVGIAQALVHDPDLLILDEPTEGLDPIQIIEIRELIRSLRGSHTVILSTHILPEAQAMSDRVVIINRGRIVAIDTTHNLMTRVQRAQRMRIEVRGPQRDVAARLKAIAGVQQVKVDESKDGTTSFLVEGAMEKDIRQSVSETIVKSGWSLLELDTLEITLEDVFLQITRESQEGARTK
jgi:ABC-2 type transport system ATP-binding protein